MFDSNDELDQLVAEIADLQAEFAMMARKSQRKSSNCGANAQGGGGFQPGNKCAGDGNGSSDSGSSGGKGGSKADAHNLPKGDWKKIESGTPEFEKYKSQLYELVNNAYKGIEGGHIKITGKGPDSLDRYRYWLVSDIDDDPEIDVAIFGKGEFGVKSAGVGHDGSNEAVSVYKNKSAEMRKTQGWWGEVSDKAAYAMLSRGAPAVEDRKIVDKLLGGDDYKWHGEHPDADAPPLFKKHKGWYTKDFGAGGKHTKIITGIPEMPEDSE